MATATLGQNTFQGRGRSPPRAPSGAGLPRPCGLSSSARPQPLDCLFEEEETRDGSKSPFYHSMGSTMGSAMLFPPDDLGARATVRRTPRRPEVAPMAPMAPREILEAEDEAYYSEPEREVPFVRTPKELPRCETLGDFSTSAEDVPRPASLQPVAKSPRRRRSRDGRDANRASSGSSRSARRVEHSPARTSASTAVSAAKCAAKSVAAATREEPQFLDWLADELQSRPDEEQLPRVPRSHLEEVAKVPPQLERSSCCWASFCAWTSCCTSSASRPCRHCAPPCSCCAAGRCQARRKALTITEQGDFLRLSLLILNVTLILMVFDVSWMYHYIRGESFLKLYVLFNMLEMFERWCRSVGVDLFDLLLASVRQPWRSLLLKYAVTLAYCFVHATMHLIRVILLNVAINTSSNAVFLIIVTNNFAEIKSTVFKRYEEKSLFPIITSDMVERFYLLLDILFVLARLIISQHSGTFTALDVSFWLFLLVVLEIGTDWIKFCLITKFSEMQAKTFEVYREVLMADILLCRCGQLSGQASALVRWSLACSFWEARR
ncbi:unnamed protein product [Effrenium voratum]|nr:unnamed protein product [Effrenium voratum]